MSLVSTDTSSASVTLSENAKGAASSETTAEDGVISRLKHFAYGCAWAMMPERARVLPYIWWRGLKHYLTPAERRPAPDPSIALNFGEGLVGICDRLTPELILENYAKGFYAFGHVGPLKWWTPPERWVLFFDETHLEKNLRRLLRQKKYRVTFDQDFDAVIRGCAAPRPGRRHLTWINETQIDCFKTLNQMGHAHSVEVWDAEGELVGGLYGLSIGRVFFTESQFFTKRDASKVGFAVLNQHLQHWGFAVNDGKNETPHLRQSGFTSIPRNTLRSILDTHASLPFMVGAWSVDPALDEAAWVPAESPGLTRSSMLEQ